MSEMRLWDDNPTGVDLLGFASIVDTVVTTLEIPYLDPVTIGIAAPWGGGKSTVLRLLHKELDGRDGYRVIRLDPWEFDDQFDVRGGVIGEVLQDLLSAYGAQEGLPEKINGLLERVSWSRVAVSMARGSLVAQSEDLVEALTPRSKSDARSLAGFREEFARLLRDLTQLKRLVVLVDDLDRCLPDAVMATLEAIKLFLSVEKVAFVLAADQDMVRESIAASLDATGRGSGSPTAIWRRSSRCPCHCRGSAPTRQPPSSLCCFRPTSARRSTTHGWSSTPSSGGPRGSRRFCRIYRVFRGSPTGPRSLWPAGWPPVCRPTGPEARAASNASSTRSPCGPGSPRARASASTPR